MKTYFVKIPSGYFFAVGRGRYGRFGTKLEAWALCEKHKDEIVKVLDSIANNDEEKPVVEDAGASFCTQCHIKKINND